MARTRFTGPVYSSKGFRFSTSKAGDRSMTVTNTIFITAPAATNIQSSCTLINTQCGGLSKILTAWGQVRQRTAATLIFVQARPLNTYTNPANSVSVTLVGNSGTGTRFKGRACTVDIFMLGYMS